MSKLHFTNQQVEVLSKNPYVKNISHKAITYSDEFKVHFIAERENGKLTRTIFEEAGFPAEVLGKKRLNNFSHKWLNVYKEKGITAVKDSRKNTLGRPRNTELSMEEKLLRAEQEINLLKQENELLKKLDFVERRGNRLTKKEKFHLIKRVTAKSNSMSVQKACSLMEVSTSGYYAHFSSPSQKKRSLKDQKDEFWRHLVIEGMNYKKVEKGSRSIVMYFLNTKGICVNRKKIQRIMRKFHLECLIRRANPYKRIAKATKEHCTVSNLLKRNFNQQIPKKILLTDITYLHGKNGFLGYLSTILDGSTKEILSYSVSNRITLDIALNTVDELIKKHGHALPKDCMIHSDQGVHYTSPHFQKLVKQNGLLQSMSRRGNCWDNSPQESWFGHLKDEINYKNCSNLTELKILIDEYIDYYNYERGQWNLKKLIPVQYRNQLLEVST